MAPNSPSGEHDVDDGGQPGVAVLPSLPFDSVSNLDNYSMQADLLIEESHRKTDSVRSRSASDASQYFSTESDEGKEEEEVTAHALRNQKNPDVDGGWAWAVFIAGFLQFMVSSGMYYSFSIFFVELLQTFEESRAKTGWVYSTNSAVHMFSGPVGGFVIVHWGPRVAIILGGLLAGLGYLLTAFAPSLNVVFITYSFINAVGTSLNFSGWIVGLARFWNHHHALVLGIVMSGSGCGVFLIGPSMELIVSHYGWRGAMLLCAGLSLNFCVFGATIYRDPRKTAALSRPLTQENNCLLISDPSPAEKINTRIKDDVSSNSKVSSNINDAAESDTRNEERPIGKTSSLASQMILGSSWSLNNSHLIENKWERVKLWIKSLMNTNRYRRSSTEKKVKDATGSESVKLLLYNPKFWFLEASCFLSFMATTTVFTFFLDWTRWKNLSASFSYALAGSGAGDVVGRFFAGFLMGRGLPPLILFSGIQLLLAITTGCAAIAVTDVQQIASMVGFGIACGLQSVLYALMPSTLSSGVSMARVLGYLLLVTGAGALIGPPLAGLLVDLTDSYNSVMLLCTLSPMAAAVFNLAAHFTDRYHKQIQADHTSTQEKSIV